MMKRKWKCMEWKDFKEKNKKLKIMFLEKQDLLKNIV